MMGQQLGRYARMVLAASVATSTIAVVGLASPTRAALPGNVTPFEIDSNTVATSGTVAQNDEGNEAPASDVATVGLITIPPTVDVTTTDADATLNEPGGPVTYTITVTNTSSEPVAVTTLTDTIFYDVPVQQIGPIDLLDPVAPVSNVQCDRDLSLDPGETATCTFVVVLSGTAQIVEDTVN